MISFLFFLKSEFLWGEFCHFFHSLLNHFGGAEVLGGLGAVLGGIWAVWEQFWAAVVQSWAVLRSLPMAHKESHRVSVQD